MRTRFYEVDLLFSEGTVNVLLSEDFEENCLSPDPHIHSHTKYELQYVISGRCELALEKSSIECPEEHILIIPPSTEHKIRARGDVKTKALLFTLKGGADGAVIPALRVNAPVLVPDSLHMNERLFRIGELSIKKDTIAKECARGELTLFFAELASLLSPSQTERQESCGENRAEKISSYIYRECFSPDCSAEDLAARLHLSARQLHRLCIEYFGLPFRALLNRTRMEIAKYRLENTSVSVTDLAETLGYASLSSFSAAYKRHFGVSPKSKA